MNEQIFLIHSLAKGTDLSTDTQLRKVPEAEWAKSRDDQFPPIWLGTFSFYQASEWSFRYWNSWDELLAIGEVLCEVSVRMFLAAKCFGFLYFPTTQLKNIILFTNHNRKVNFIFNYVWTFAC